MTKSDVMDAAVKLLNAGGPEALTLKGLADELGIQTPSLYNHIDGLPGLQRDLTILNARQLADCLGEAAIGRSGPELFMAVAQAFRLYVKENPGLYLSTLRASGTQEAPDPGLTREEERSLKIALAVMSSLGLQGEDAIHAARAYRSTVHGFASLEVAGGFGLPQDLDESFRRLVDALTDGLKQKGIAVWAVRLARWQSASTTMNAQAGGRDAARPNAACTRTCSSTRMFGN